jgi:hypothetical protein
MQPTKRNLYNSIEIPKDSNIDLIQALTGAEGHGRYSPILSRKLVNLDNVNLSMDFANQNPDFERMPKENPVSIDKEQR